MSKMASLTRARLRMHRITERELLKGHVRECRQWTPYGSGEVIRYDFAFTDPASGRYQQYCTRAHIPEGLPREAVDEQIAEPSVACIAMLIERKCGIKQAIANQVPLSLPTAVANCRMV